MLPRSSTFYSVLALLVLAAALAFLSAQPKSRVGPTSLAPVLTATSTLEASTATPIATTTPDESAEHTKVSVTSISKKTPDIAPTSTTGLSSATASNSANQAVRIENPYPSPPGSSDAINALTRAALVNILCVSYGAVRPISGSGVIIDPRGIILTNAHVAQYVLLSENPRVLLSCVIRTGSPARNAWTGGVLYIPPVWVAAHVSELNTGQAEGTGEHDYALIQITNSIDGSALPAAFPALLPDTRNAIGFPGDQVLVAGYGAEFLGALETQNDLYAISSLATIGQPFTFGSGSVDVISLGGVLEAQSGSSGGAVVNPWGRLIGLITTTSEGTTTAQRDLHALTPHYISEDLQTQTGADLSAFLAGDLPSEQANFNAHILPGLMDQYMARINATHQ